MNFKLEVKLEADFELTDIFSYYDAISINLGNNFLANWEETTKEICKNPLGYEAKYKNFRHALLGNFPYLIIFEVTDKTVVVFSVIHARKHPEKRYKKHD